MKAPIPETEPARLAALRDSRILDTPPDDAFDDVVRLAARICGVPIAAVSLVDSDRQWFKSILGLDVRETSRDAAFCAHTILQPDVLVVPDAQDDARFADNPLVTGDPSIRFYAGASLVTPEGHALGSLCVIDRIPRRLTPDQQSALGTLARQVAAQIELGRRIAAQERLTAEREEAAALFRSAIESMQEGFVLQDRTAAIHLCNPRAEEILGLTADQLMGRTSLDPEWRAIRADGTDFPGAEHPAVVSLRDGLPQNGVVMGVHKPDGTLTWVSVNSTPTWTGGVDGPTGVVCTFADVTASKQAEEERARLAAIVESSDDAITGATLDGTLVSWNTGAERLYGYAASEVIGRHASVLAPPEERGFFSEVIRAIRRGERRENVEVRRRRKSGEWMDVSMTFSPIRNAGGEITGVAAIGRNVTVQKRTLETLRQSEEALRTVMEGAPILMYATDREGVVTLSEGAGLFRLGLAPGEVVGRSVFEMYRDRPDIADNLRRALNGEAVAYEAHLGDLYYHNEVRPLRDEAGQICGMIGVGHDVTERRQAEEALRRSQERLEQAQHLAHVGSWEMDLATQEVTWSQEMYRLFEFDPAGGPPTFEVVRARYHPDDLARRDEAFQATLAEGTPYVLYMRLVLPSDRIRWCQVRGQVERDAAGRAVRLTGTVMDATERKQAEEALRHSRERLEQAQAVAHVGHWEQDCRTGTFYWSPETFRLYGLPPAPAPPALDEFLALVHPEDRAALLAHWQAVRVEGTPQDWEHRVIRPSGEVRHVRAILECIRDEDGTMVAFQGTLIDVTERRQAEQTLKDFAVVLEYQKGELETVNAELERLATTDALTGLHNRRAFDGRLREEFERASRYGTPLSLLLLDLDRFKEYNDAFGHPEGDEVLRRVGRVLARAMRETDFLARYGGEEIALILPETDGDGSMVVAERVRLAIAAAGWDKREVTASVGVTTLRLGMDRPEEMIADADRALYRSKAGGRDRVTHGRGRGQPVGT